MDNDSKDLSMPRNSGRGEGKEQLEFISQKTGLAQKVYRFGAKSLGEKSNSVPEVHGDFLNQEQLDLDFRGYPKLPSTMSGAGMNLAYTFEDTFGHKLGEGIWRKFNEGAFSTIDLNVVALASFNGEKRFFACTGFFIAWNGSMIILTSASLVRTSGDENKIVENLRIQVALNNQNNKYEEGMLEHYDLHYNIALVSIKNYPAVCPLNTLVRWAKSFKVAAVGRCFESGVLMATSGDMVSWSGTLDCEFIVRSTCKISKAGIGGPLVNFDGDVIGMNFYDKRIGTPFLLWEDICKILAYFETKSKLSEVGNDSYCSGAPCKLPRDDKIKLNRWPVPMPRWRYCGEDESDDELGFEPKSDRKYGYVNREKIELY